jgi:hypothetical protein
MKRNSFSKKRRDGTSRWTTARRVKAKLEHITAQLEEEGRGTSVTDNNEPRTSSASTLPGN